MTFFIYQTLKQGFENNYFLYSAKFIGKVTTREKHPIVNIIKAYPDLLANL